MEFKLGELFCGPGGIAWGATNADIKNDNFKIVHEWANDYDHDTCETYRNNICDDNRESVFEGDVRQLDYSKLTPIDALAFGFPCNDYSVVGEQKGMDGNYGPLYSYGVQALIRFQPQWFLAENVGGLRNANEGRAFSKILGEMQAAGYTLYPHLYQFEDYGIPQARHRIIIVGIRNDIDVEYKVPSPANYRMKTCKEAIEEPPIPEDATNNELTRQSAAVVERLRYIRPGENAFTANLPENLQLNVIGAKISQIYKRLDPDKPAYTVTGSGGGGTHIYHWEEPRALTNRERARLQTFPDTYEFYGNKESVRKQIGMAVPCEGAKIIFEAILKCFAGIDYDAVECNATEYLFNGDNEIKWQFDSDLENKVLIEPVKEGANELRIVSAYASPSMVAWHMQALADLELQPIQIKLIVGMCPFDGLSQVTNSGFKKLSEHDFGPDFSSFSCQYVYKTPAVHSKLYLWMKNGKPYKAFSGSANYTLKGFSKDCDEFITECNLDDAVAYFDKVESKTIYCTANEVENYIRIYRTSPNYSYEATMVDFNSEEKQTLSFLTSAGEVPATSSLNWGQREHRDPNQAYIPLPSKISKTGFFPLNQRYFTVVADDGECFIMRVEQAGNKAITTPSDNAEIGRYFRNRLGIHEGVKVTKEHFGAYGRSDVTFTKLDDEHFLMDFSVVRSEME